MQDVLMRWAFRGSVALVLMLPLSVGAQDAAAPAEQQAQAEASPPMDSDVAAAISAAPTEEATSAEKTDQTDQTEAAESAKSAESNESEGQVASLPSVTHERLLQGTSNATDWLMYGGNYESWRFSPLTDISRDNVKTAALDIQREPQTKHRPGPKPQLRQEAPAPNLHRNR